MNWLRQNSARSLASDIKRAQRNLYRRFVPGIDRGSKIAGPIGSRPGFEIDGSRSGRQRQYDQYRT